MYEQLGSPKMVNVKKKPILALIIAAPGPLQDGLLALMTTADQISAVFVAEEAFLALRMIKDHRPKLVLLDIHLLEAQMVLKRIKSQWSETVCIVLVDSVEQEREVKEADAVFLEGFSPSLLLETIIKLLAQS